MICGGSVRKEERQIDHDRVEVHWVTADRTESRREHLGNVRQPTVTLAVLTQLVKRTRTVTRRVFELSTLHVDNRIQAEVLRLATLAGRVGKGARIVPAPTHVEIASRVSTHREAVTRELNRLSRIGLVTRSGDALLVTDIERLAQMIQDVTGEP